MCRLSLLLGPSIVLALQVLLSSELLFCGPLLPQWAPAVASGNLHVWRCLTLPLLPYACMRTGVRCIKLLAAPPAARSSAWHELSSAVQYRAAHAQVDLPVTSHL